jgi:alginate O-acetyltransferase complex protein AlgI
VLFNSYLFIFLFLPLTLVGFFAIGGRGHHRAAMGWLVGASIFYYGWWNFAYVGLLLFSILFNYGLGFKLSQISISKSAKRLILTFGIVSNLSLLGYFKYANFFVENLNWFAGTNIDFGQIILPLAISFFTFQQVAYLCDTYKGLTQEHNFLHYCMFVTFFPQLIAGPIVHHREMLPQFTQKFIYKFRSTNFAAGLAMFAIGLFKKVIIADGMAVYATPVFDAADAGYAVTFIEAWGGGLAYTFQLYFDFSGYSDMALGLGRMFGIRLPINFHSPYKATSIIDFWRRWHITLSRFLRDYLYIPLGGNQKGTSRRHANILITMLLGGLWHGAGWNFIVWGGLHGIYLGINHAWRKISAGSSGTNIKSPASTLISWCITFLCVVVAWVFFRAQTFDGAFEILAGMSGLNGVDIPNAYLPLLAPIEGFADLVGIKFIDGELTYFYGFQQVGALVGLLLVVVALPNTYEFVVRSAPGFGPPKVWKFLPFRLKWRLTPTWGFIIGVASALSLFGVFGEHEFLYFQF